MANTDKIVGGVNITELANKLRSGETTIAQASSTSAVDKNIVPTNTQSVSTANTNNVVVDGLDITDLANRLRSGETTIKSTAQINNTPTIAPNATSTTYPKVDVTSADSINALNVAEQERINTEKLAAQTALSKSGLSGTGSTLQEQLFTGYQANAPVADYKTALTTAQNEYGLTEGLSEYKLQSEKVSTAKAAIENLDLQRQNELDIASNRQASMTSIAAEKDAINETYDSQRVQLVGDYNIEAAVLSAQAGYLSEANNLVDNAVQAYTAAITAEIKRFDNMYSLASDWVSSLEADEKALLEDAKAELETKKEEETTRLNSVLSLKVEYPSAGISDSDTIESAMNKVAEYEKNNPTVSQTLGSAETGYTMYDKYGNVIGTKSGVDETKDNPTIFDSLMQGVIDAGGDVNGAVAAANELAQSQYGTSLSFSELNNLIKRANSMTKKVKTKTEIKPLSSTSNLIKTIKDNSNSNLGSLSTTSWFNQLFND